jgi:hypothetical protein
MKSVLPFSFHTCTQNPTGKTHSKLLLYQSYLFQTNVIPIEKQLLQKRWKSLQSLLSQVVASNKIANGREESMSFIDPNISPLIVEKSQLPCMAVCRGRGGVWLSNP